MPLETRSKGSTINTAQEHHIVNNGGQSDDAVKVVRASPGKSGSAIGNVAIITRTVPLHEQYEQDTMLRVQVESSVRKTTFYVPISLVAKRETEMKKAARKGKISKERWTSSRLYQLWEQHSQTGKEDEITLHLEPEVSMQDHFALTWEPWLTTCIRAYYNTGTVRVPDQCIGPEILLAMEYFGILTTSSDTFVFDSYPAYERVKVWSDYFMHRDAIAEWIAQKYIDNEQESEIWVTSPQAMEVLESEVRFHVSKTSQSARCLIGGVEANGNHLSFKIIHDLFVDNNSTNQLTQQLPVRTRHDFCSRLQRALPRSSVTFDTERVVITFLSSGRASTEMRPVLRIQKEDPRGQLQSHKHYKQQPAKKTPGTALADYGTDGAASVSSTYLAESLIAVASNLSEQFGGPRLTTAKTDTTANRVTREGQSVQPQTAVGVDPISQGGLPHYSSPQQMSSPQINNQLGSRRNNLQQIEGSAPIRFVNTSMGDLRSVTSGLSGPDVPSKLECVVTSRNIGTCHQPGNPSTTTMHFPDTVDRAAIVKPVERYSEVGEITEHRTGLTQAANQANNSIRPCTYWDNWLVGVCHAIAPGSVDADPSTNPVKDGNFDLEDSNNENLQTQNVQHIQDGTTEKGYPKNPSGTTSTRVEDNLVLNSPRKNIASMNSRSMRQVISSDANELLRNSRSVERGVRSSNPNIIAGEDTPLPEKPARQRGECNSKNADVISSRNRNMRSGTNSGTTHRSLSPGNLGMNQSNGYEEVREIRNQSSRDSGSKRHRRSKESSGGTGVQRQNNTPTPKLTPPVTPPVGFELHVHARDSRRMKMMPPIARKKKDAASRKVPPRYPQHFSNSLVFPVKNKSSNATSCKTSVSSKAKSSSAMSDLTLDSSITTPSMIKQKSKKGNKNIKGRRSVMV